MSKETVTNTWKDGLNKDLNPMITPNTVLTDNLNGTLITYNGNEFSLQNDMGNINVGEISEGFYPIGMTEHGGILYIVSVKDRSDFRRYTLFLPSDYNTDETIEHIISEMKEVYPYFGQKEAKDLIKWFGDDDSSDSGLEEDFKGWLYFFPEHRNQVIAKLIDLVSEYDHSTFDESDSQHENLFEVGSYPSLPRVYEGQPVELEKEYPFEYVYRPLYNLYDTVDTTITVPEEIIQYDNNYYVCVKLTDYSAKLQSIKDIKSVTGLDLKSCKQMVDAGECITGEETSENYYEYISGQPYGWSSYKSKTDEIISTINDNGASIRNLDYAFGVVEIQEYYEQVYSKRVVPKDILFNFTTELLPKYNKQHPVTIETQPSYDGSVNLILNDNNDVPRLINTGFATTGNGYGKFIEKNFQSEGYYYKDIEETTRLIYKNFKFPYIELDDVSSSNGNLPGGNYTLYLKFGDTDGNLTDISCQSSIISVFLGDTKDLTSIQGSFFNENSNKSISFTIKNLDTTYKKIYVYYTREYCDQNGYRLVDAKMLKDPFDLTSDSQSIIITGYEQTEDVSIEDLNIYFHNISNAKAIAQQSDMLFLGNVSSSKINYEALTLLSYQIEVSTVQEHDIGWVDPKTYASNTGTEYYDIQNIYNYLGYWPNEFYRFGIVYLLNDNSHTNVLDLKGCLFSNVGEKNTDRNHTKVTIYDINNILLNSETLDNTKGVFKTPNVRLFSDNEKVLPLSFKFKIPKHIQNELAKFGIIGYQIVRQKRIPTILCQGYSVGINWNSFYPMIKYNGDYIAESFVWYDNSPGVPETDNYLLKYDPISITPDSVNYTITHNWYIYENKEYGSYLPVTYKNIKLWIWFSMIEASYLMGDYYDENNPNDSGYAPWIYDYYYKNYKQDRVEKIYFSCSKNVAVASFNTALGTNNVYYLKQNRWVKGWPTAWTFDDIKQAAATAWNSAASGESIEDARNDCVEYAASLQPPISVSSYPLNKNNVNAESFLNHFDDQDDSSDDELGYTFRNGLNALDNGFGLLSIEANINPELQSRLNGSKYIIDKIYDCGDLDHRSVLFSANEYDPKYSDKISSNCLFIPSNTNLKYISSQDIGFSTKVGDATDVAGFKSLSGTSIEGSDHPISDVIRGLFAPYIGCYNVSEYEANHLYNISIDVDDKEFVLNIGNNSNEYYAVSNKYTLDYESIVYQGDCYTNTVTVRMHSNFIDPDVRIADKIVDIKKWQEAFRGTNPIDKNYKNWRDQLNLSDLNTVSIGHWITFKCMSSTNLALRSEDTSNVTEYADLGNPRSFYPHSAASTATTMKVPDTTLFNHGYDATVGRIRYSIKEKTPYDKNEFGTRVMFSNVAITDSFQNGYRTFQGMSYKDYPTTYGDIIKLLPWGQNLFCVFEHGIAIIPVNQKALMNTTTEDTIHIYGYGVLPEDLSVISQDFGSIWADSVIRTPLGIYGVDTYTKKIWQYTDSKGLVTISDMKIQRFLNDEINIGLKSQEDLGVTNVKTHYNIYKGDVMFTFYNTDDKGIKKEWNICYNERQGLWITRYSWIPLLSANADNTFYSIELHKWSDSNKNTEEDRPFGIWKHGRTGVDRLILPTHWYDIQEPFEFEFVAGEPMGIDKIFENLKITSNNVQPESFDFQIIGDDYLFNKARIWRDVEYGEQNEIYHIGPENGIEIPYQAVPDNSNYTKDNYVKDSEFSLLDDYSPLFYNASITYDRVLDEYTLIVHQNCKNKETHGVRLGNIQYKENGWDTNIEPLRYNSNLKNPEILPKDLKTTDKFVSAKLRDKWIKIRIKYKGDRLAIIGAVTTFENTSYA